MNEQYLEVVRAIKTAIFMRWQLILQASTISIVTGCRFYIGENAT